ncbi:phosphate acyltransferase, partial [bacterium]|nr:phosphate acyltransferase [bacterium]
SELLKKNQNLNYVGFVETRNMLNNKDCDIFVCNGYTGNIILKTLEGSMKTIANFFKNEYHK